MPGSFFFYDLETSGFSPRAARIMQFAGQRTDMNLKPVGKPVNVLIKITPDVLPDPGSVLVTGITPQQTLADGISEAEFLELFYKEVVRPDTIFVGYNNIRFDDEFMRFLHYRNFYDAYEWQWASGCSRWDLLDAVRMARALRPEGVKWPFGEDGKPTNRLELITKLNGLDHEHAHDALNDVMATIAVARLLRQKQPDLFNWLLNDRGKKDVAKLVEQPQPFVYTSGRYSSEYFHTTIATRLCPHPQPDAALVYDLRFDPTPYLNMSPQELVQAWQWRPPADTSNGANADTSQELPRLPVKTLKYNRCPAVAPLGVLKDKKTQERLQLPMETALSHLQILKKHQKTLATKITEAVKLLDKERDSAAKPAKSGPLPADQRLYDGFISKKEAELMRQIRTSAPEGLSSFVPKLQDKRLAELLPIYKARNYSSALTAEERTEWDKHCKRQLFDGGQQSRMAIYFEHIQQLSQNALGADKEYLLEELRLYGESIVPLDEGGDADG